MLCSMEFLKFCFFEIVYFCSVRKALRNRSAVLLYTDLARHIVHAAGHALNHSAHIHDERENHGEGNQRVDLLGIHGDAEQPVSRALNGADDHAAQQRRE